MWIRAPPILLDASFLTKPRKAPTYESTNETSGVEAPVRGNTSKKQGKKRHYSTLARDRFDSGYFISKRFYGKSYEYDITPAPKNKPETVTESSRPEIDSESKMLTKLIAKICRIFSKLINVKTKTTPF